MIVNEIKRNDISISQLDIYGTEQRDIALQFNLEELEETKKTWRKPQTYINRGKSNYHTTGASPWASPCLNGGRHRWVGSFIS